MKYQALSVELKDMYKLQGVDGDSPSSGGVRKWSGHGGLGGCTIRNSIVRRTHENLAEGCIIGNCEHCSKIFESPANHLGDWH